jgi:hypothetical protein
VPRRALAGRWRLHVAPRYVKKAGTRWVAAAASHHVWGSAHAVLLLPAATAACARWPALLLWPLVITVAAQECHVILILTLETQQQSTYSGRGSGLC